MPYQGYGHVHCDDETHGSGLGQTRRDRLWGLAISTDARLRDAGRGRAVLCGAVDLWF